MNEESAMLLLDTISRNTVSWVCQAVLLGTIVALLGWLLTSSVMRRARPALHGAVWLIVLVKFIVPSGPGFNYSLSSLVDRLADRHALAASIPAAERSGDASSAALTAAELEAALNSAVSPIHRDSPSVASVSRPMRLTTCFALAYVLAVLVIGTLRIASYRLFARRCRRLPTANTALTARVRRACVSGGLARMPEVRLSDAASAPFVFGALRPTLVLSRRQLEDWGTLDAIVLHEIAHLRRGDLLARYLQWLAGTLLFFWPVVAWVNRRIDLARELACDEWALRRCSLDPREYARCLLAAARPAGVAWPFHQPASMAANLKHVERRIDMILRTNGNRFQPRAGYFGAAIVLAWGGFVLSGAAAGPLAPDQAQSKKVVVTATGQDGRAHVVIDSAADTAKPRAVRPPNDGAPTQVRLVGVSDKQLADFARQHAAADVNADGAVSRSERAAFLVALSMADPAAVLKRFTHADRDHDGTLSPLEAARLVTDEPESGVYPAAALSGSSGGARLIQMRPKDAQAQNESRAGTPEDRDPSRARKIKSGNVSVTKSEDGKTVHVVIKDDDGNVIHESDAPAGESEQRFMIKVPASGADKPQAGAPDSHATVAINPDGQLVHLAERPDVWLLRSIDAEPGTAQVASYLSVVERAPRVALFERHPDADSNGDQTVSAAERDAFQKQAQQRAMKKILEQHPEADANHDGVLTLKELEQHFHDAGVGQAIRIGHASGKPGQAVKVRLKENPDKE